VRNLLFLIVFLQRLLDAPLGVGQMKTRGKTTVNPFPQAPLLALLPSLGNQHKA
jgi:hypothetical protein